MPIQTNEAANGDFLEVHVSGILSQANTNRLRKQKCTASITTPSPERGTGWTRHRTL